MFNAEFVNQQDHLGHTDDVILRQSQFVELTTLAKGKGDKCMKNDWATVNFTGYLPNGDKVYDSYEKTPLNF